MANRVMVSGYYGFENFGDDLILEVIVQQLQECGFVPVVLSGNPALTLKQYPGVEALPRAEVGAIWKALGDMRAFISGGGGLFQDVTGPASPIYYGGLIEMAHWRRCPVAFFGQGIGPLSSRLGRFLTSRALSHAGLIVVRDVKSQALAYQLMGTLRSRNVGLMGDPVWMWQPPADSSYDESRPLGISLRPWGQLRDEDIQHLANVLAQIPQVKAAGLNLIDCQAGVDILPLAKLEKALKAYQIRCFWFAETQAQVGIAQSSGLLAMRFHAVLTAARMGIPTVTLSYDPKVQLLAAQLKLTDYPVHTLMALQAEDIQDALKPADPATVQTLTQDAQKGFSLLKNWLIR